MEASWDDLKLFLYVAEGGGLSAAAERTGISAPTIGRRMLALEHTMNRVLFLRSRTGYELAQDGLALLERVRDMQQISSDISDWHSGAFRDPFVGVAGDAWIATFVADHANTLSKGPGDVRFCCKVTSDGISMVNRYGYVWLTTDPPKSGNFAVRRSVKVAYAVYQNQGLGHAKDRPWVSIGKEEALEPAERWVFERYDREIYSWTNNMHLLPSLIASGQGRGVLPCFIGDRYHGIERSGDIIEDLTTRLHIVVNDDDRKRPEVRLVIDRLVALLSENTRLFSGVLA